MINERELFVVAEISRAPANGEVEEHLIQTVKRGWVVGDVKLVGEELLACHEPREILLRKDAHGPPPDGGTRVLPSPGGIHRQPGLAVRHTDWRKHRDRERETRILRFVLCSLSYLCARVCNDGEKAASRLFFFLIYQAAACFFKLF